MLHSARATTLLGRAATRDADARVAAVVAFDGPRGPPSGGVCRFLRVANANGRNRAFIAMARRWRLLIASKPAPMRSPASPILRVTLGSRLKSHWTARW